MPPATFIEVILSISGQVLIIAILRLFSMISISAVFLTLYGQSCSLIWSWLLCCSQLVDLELLYRTENISSDSERQFLTLELALILPTVIFITSLLLMLAKTGSLSLLATKLGQLKPSFSDID